MKNVFFAFGLAIAMLLTARPTILALCSINRYSVEKDLGFPFCPILIKGKLVKFFWGKWTHGFFECGGIRKISLMFFIHLPFDLLMIISILVYLVVIIVAILTGNEELMNFAYKKYGFIVVIYTILMGNITAILVHWARIWKAPKVSIKQQIEFTKKLNEDYKKAKNIEWHSLLWEELKNITCSSNNKKLKYWFEVSQIDVINELVSKSSPNAMLKLELKNEKPYKFVVQDNTNNSIVFQGFFKN